MSKSKVQMTKNRVLKFSHLEFIWHLDFDI